MQHPFQAIPPGQLRRVFVPAFLLYLALQMAFAWLDVPLRTAVAPNGVVSFELAGNAATARAILDSWNETARLDASFGLGLDFLFMAAYSTAIGLGCVWAGRVFAERHAGPAFIAGFLAWSLWAAVAFDSAENLVLFAQLLRGAGSPLAEIAAICASGKFLLIILGLVYAALGALTFLVDRRHKQMRLVGIKGR